MKRQEPALPLEDPAVDALPPEVREAIGTQWQARATAEIRVSSVFASLATQLYEAGADPEVLSIVSRAIHDEFRHASLCRTVASRYLGREVPWPKPGPAPMPKLQSASETLRPTLHLVAMGCINETIASAWLERSYAEASVPLARATLRALLADDIDHARAGWGHLAAKRTTHEMKNAISAWLVAMLQAAALPWLRPREEVQEALTVGALADGIADHGIPSHATTREVVVSTVRSVVFPGFDALGVDTRAARRWFTEMVERPTRSGEPR